MHQLSTGPKFAVNESALRRPSSTISQELVRKSLHLLIALTPTLAQLYGTDFMMAFLAMGVLGYVASEWVRFSGGRIPVISAVTEYSMRPRDSKRFVLGPVTLGLGAMLSLMLYPEPAASIAIYALAFGDGLASVAGRVFGTVKIPFTKGKSIEGSLTCFLAVLVSILVFVPAIQPRQAMQIAAVATLLEAIPSADFDNLILPLGTGITAVLVVGL